MKKKISVWVVSAGTQFEGGDVIGVFFSIDDARTFAYKNIREGAKKTRETTEEQVWYFGSDFLSMKRWSVQ